MCVPNDTLVEQKRIYVRIRHTPDAFVLSGVRSGRWRNHSDSRGFVAVIHPPHPCTIHLRLIVSVVRCVQTKLIDFLLKKQLDR